MYVPVTVELNYKPQGSTYGHRHRSDVVRRFLTSGIGTSICQRVSLGQGHGISPEKSRGCSIRCRHPALSVRVLPLTATRDLLPQSRVSQSKLATCPALGSRQVVSPVPTCLKPASSSQAPTGHARGAGRPAPPREQEALKPMIIGHDPPPAARRYIRQITVRACRGWIVQYLPARSTFRQLSSHVRTAISRCERCPSYAANSTIPLHGQLFQGVQKLVYFSIHVLSGRVTKFTHNTVHTTVSLTSTPKSKTHLNLSRPTSPFCGL
uniref:Uncharacterized protein n=1 Tax=Branchiostoma floridae TaxID=7739 RepID=C3YXX6_BRAFL|eukprot:XP_002598923.1 hypothetical protein BRAFLDRAFT_122446 [Branchiostoma floridae]